MTPAQRRNALIVLGLLFVGLRTAVEVLGHPIPDGFYFAAAAIALFRFGYTLQNHAIKTLRKFHMNVRTAIWLSAVTAFWYSTLIWVWWSRKTTTFPLFLLNAELRTNLYFDWTIVAVVLGLALEARESRVQKSE